MIQNIKNKEKIIYDELCKMQNGNDSDKLFVSQCMGILGNESTVEKIENRLNIVEKLIKNYYENNK